MSTALAVGSCVAAACLVMRHRVRSRMRLRPDRNPPQLGEMETGLLELDRHLARLVTDRGELGRLVQIKPGDTIDGLAFDALSVIRDPESHELLSYIHCISSGRFNLDRYGTPSTSKLFPEVFRIPGIARGIRVAFLPRNSDSQRLLRAGWFPPMTVDSRTGARVVDSAESYGLAWFPPIDEEDYRNGGAPSCASISWEDGSSSIDPPYRFTRLLRTFR